MSEKLQTFNINETFNGTNIDNFYNNETFIKACNRYEKFILRDVNVVYIYIKNKKIHNDIGPAVIYSGIIKYIKYEWWVNGIHIISTSKNKSIKVIFNEKGEIHNESGPAIIFDNYKDWRINNELHRLDGPAIVWNNGDEEWYKNGMLHRLDGPAIIHNGDKEWYQNGKLHRENAPAIEWGNSTKKWYINGLLHREDGPAVERIDYEAWYQNDVLHRVDGPAIVKSYGRKEWYQNGELHRLDGPAIEDIYKMWFIDGIKFTEEDYNILHKIRKKQLIKLCNKYARKWYQIYDHPGTIIWKRHINENVDGIIDLYEKNDF